MSLENAPAIIFDINGTLSNPFSWRTFSETLGASGDEHDRIVVQRQNPEISPQVVEKQMIGLWNSTGNATQKRMRDIFFDNPHWALKPEAERVVATLRERYNVCLISWGLDLYVRTVAEKLAVPYFYANTKLLFDVHGCLYGIDSVHDHAEAKIKKLWDYLRDSRITTNRYIAIWNGSTDLGLFRICPAAIAIEPESPEVTAFANKVVGSLDELLRPDGRLITIPRIKLGNRKP